MHFFQVFFLISSYHFLLQLAEQSTVSNAILGRILGATTLSTILFTNITCHQLENVKAVVSKWCSSSELVSSKYSQLSKKIHIICNFCELYECASLNIMLQKKIYYYKFQICDLSGLFMNCVNMLLQIECSGK